MISNQFVHHVMRQVIQLHCQPLKHWYEKKLLQLLTLLARVRFRGGHFHIVGGDKACDTIDFSFPPVRVTLIQHIDDLILGEAELVLVCGRVVVQGNNLTN